MWTCAFPHLHMHTTLAAGREQKDRLEDLDVQRLTRHLHVAGHTSHVPLGSPLAWTQAGWGLSSVEKRVLERQTYGYADPVGRVDHAGLAGLAYPLAPLDLLAPLAMRLQVAAQAWAAALRRMFRVHRRLPAGAYTALAAWTESTPCKKSLVADDGVLQLQLRHRHRPQPQHQAPARDCMPDSTHTTTSKLGRSIRYSERQHLDCPSGAVFDQLFHAVHVPLFLVAHPQHRGQTWSAWPTQETLAP